MSDVVSAVASQDAALAAEIERLKVAFPKTRELYREVCALLFFHFGITPTANRLYQLVKRGSMGTPTDVLAEFWTTLREKSRVRLERPDLPPDLQAAAGELVAALWDKSTAAAHAALEELRSELDAEREAGRAEIAAAQDATVRAEAALEVRSTMLMAAQTRIQELEQALAVSDASRRTLEADVTRLQRESRERDAALAQARVDLARELEKLREDAQRAEERLRAAEKRALMEIERERATNVRLLKEGDEVVRRAEHSEARLHADAQALQTQLGDTRQQVGVLEGSLDAVHRANARYVEELKTLRKQQLASPLGGTAGRGSRRKGEPTTAARRVARSAGKTGVRKKST
jgi:chromosome segregation ATPase